MTIEGLRLNIRKQIIKYTCSSRQKKLKNKNFTIISNNCWGGMVYESFNLPKQSPTVGLFFMADEYIKFLQAFPDILNEEIEFIDPMESKYVDFLKQDSRFGSYPIGKLGGNRPKTKTSISKVEDNIQSTAVKGNNMVPESNLMVYSDIKVENEDQSKLVFGQPGGV